MPPSLQPIWNIAQICHLKGIENAIISPGSRSAPLTLAFARHPHIKCRVIADERSAAFVALGLAQQTQKPVVLICTSGSAAYNYAPAVAEAFFQHIPLVVLTADRPPEWIDQLDGQTIRQIGIYGQHVKKHYHLPVDTSHADAVWHVERTVSEAINISQTFPFGPIHINAPFREPFYPDTDQEITYDTDIKIIEQIHSRPKVRTNDWESLLETWDNTEEKLIVGGQRKYDERLVKALSQLEIPIVSDIISNLHTVKRSIKHQDVFLMNSEDLEELRPELLITFGKSIISKNLKLFLRAYPPAEHWHIQPAGEVADTFQSLTTIVPLNPSYFFRKVLEKQTRFADSYRSSFFLDNWRGTDAEIEKINHSFFSDQAFSEFEVVKHLLEAIPDGICLHLANSMAVRYANYINTQKHIEVFANRGTSGIDGSTSTAIGHAIAQPDNVHILLTGDVAFFYDRNAFWNEHLPKNLIIVLLNNQGGGIFKMLPDCRKQPECEDFFVIKQPLNAQKLSEEFVIEYKTLTEKEETKNTFSDLDWNSKTRNGITIIEAFTDTDTNTKVMAEYKKAVSNLNV